MALPLRGLEEVQVGENLIVDRQRDVVSHRAGFALGAGAQVGIELLRLRDGLLGNLVDRSRRGLLFAETVAGAEGFQLIQADGIDNVMVQGGQLRIGVEVAPAGEQLVQGFVKFFAGLHQVPGLKILFACLEGSLAALGEASGVIGSLQHQRTD